MAVDFKDYYRILGVDRKADDKTIKSAYRYSREASSGRRQRQRIRRPLQGNQRSLRGPLRSGEAPSVRLARGRTGSATPRPHPAVRAAGSGSSTAATSAAPGTSRVLPLDLSVTFRPRCPRRRGSSRGSIRERASESRRRRAGGHRNLARRGIPGGPEDVRDGRRGAVRVPRRRTAGRSRAPRVAAVAGSTFADRST